MKVSDDFVATIRAAVSELISEEGRANQLYARSLHFDRMPATVRLATMVCEALPAPDDRCLVPNCGGGSFWAAPPQPGHLCIRYFPQTPAGMRAHNCCWREGVKTVGQLLALDVLEAQADWRNFGAKSADIVRAIQIELATEPTP